MELLLAHSKKREFSRLEDFAKIFSPAPSRKGANLPPGITKVVDGASEYNGDPESVKHLSDEEKEALTQKLMGKHRSQLETLKDDPRNG